MGFYYKKISGQVRKKFNDPTDEEHGMIMDEVESYICKRLYPPPFK